MAAALASPMSPRRLKWALLARAARLHPWLFVASVGSSLLRAVLAPGFVLVSGALLGAVRMGGEVRGNLLFWLAAVALVLAVDRGLEGIPGELCDSLGRRMNADHDSRVLSLVHGCGDLRIVEDAETNNAIVKARPVGGYGLDAAVRGMFNRAGTYLSGLGAAGIVMSQNFWIGSVIGVALAINLSFVSRHYFHLVKVVHGSTGTLRRSSYIQGIALDREYAKEVRVYGLQDWLVRTYRGEWLQAMRAIWAERRRLLAPLLLSPLILLLAFAGGAGFFVAQGIGGTLTPERTFVVLQALLLALAVGNTFHDEASISAGIGVMVGFNELQERMRSMSPTRDNTMMEISSAARTWSETGSRGVSSSKIPLDIVADRVQFSYRNSPHPALRGASFVLKPNRKYALVGPNGAGKTTLARVLAGLYLPDNGTVTWGERSLSHDHLANWREHVSVIFQDFIRIPADVMSNVTFGEAISDTARLDDLASRAQVEPILRDLPDGWRTPISPSLEGGVDLSGGQWQRVALARALWRSERGGLVILDEPTANLDVAAEVEFYEHALDAAMGQTVLLISHRLSVVSRVDEVIVIDRGLVVDTGPHEHLLRKGGLYAQMYTTQRSALFEEGEA